jgi:ABC-type Na+ transport system ATPase subunit NatA
MSIRLESEIGIEILTEQNERIIVLLEHILENLDKMLEPEIVVKEGSVFEAEVIDWR